ncbi:MAG: leucine-rich repeat domain-containing protein, partial [Paludibacteraceae bacterium]|nr:leucine-rich repeat domain-containing protein [Paludibacteraceae bacterium]
KLICVSGGEEYVYIPSSVTTIERDAFSLCTRLRSINVATDNSFYSSEDGILYDKHKTKLICVPISRMETVDIPSSVTSIGDHAFKGCCGLTSIKIPSSVTSIGYDAFYGCRGLRNITIPSSVTSIGPSAFMGCKKLDVIIDNSEENVKVGSDAFMGCKSVKFLK